jgi:hypothetical protein
MQHLTTHRALRGTAVGALLLGAACPDATDATPRPLRLRLALVVRDTSVAGAVLVDSIWPFAGRVLAARRWPPAHA